MIWTAVPVETRLRFDTAMLPPAVGTRMNENSMAVERIDLTVLPVGIGNETCYRTLAGWLDEVKLNLSSPIHWMRPYYL